MNGKVRSAVISVILNGYQNKFLKFGCACGCIGMVFTSLLSRGYRPRWFVRVDVEHAFLIDRFVLIV